MQNWFGLLEFCFTFCVSCHTGCLKHWGKAGAYPLVPASVVLVLRVTFFVDQGGRGSFSIRVWVGPGVQEYISCRTRPYGGGSGEGGGQAGGWAPLGSAHCWSGAGFQQRRHLCCAHRLSRPKGTPVAPQPPKRKSLHISPFLPHTLPLRQGRIQNSQSTSVMLSWSAIARSRLVWVAVHPDVSATAPSSKYRSLTMSCPGHRSSTFCPKCPGT